MFNIFKKKADKKIFIKDRSSMYIWCNDAYARDLRIKPEEIEGKSDYNFYNKGEAEKRIADEKKIIEAGKVREFDKKYEEKNKVGWIKEILISLRDGSNEASGILGISWDITQEKNCELEKEKIIKEIKEAISLFAPIFNNLSQGNFDKKIKLPENKNSFSELYNSCNLAIDNLKRSRKELQYQINRKNEELEANKVELNNTQSELEQEKEKNNQKEKELEQEKLKVEEVGRELKENKKQHKKFVVNMLRDLEEKIKNISSS